jgi:hypothetical protein
MEWQSGSNTVYADAFTVCLDASVAARFVAIVITLAFLVQEITAGTLWKLQGRPGPVIWLVLLIAPLILGELLPINSVVWYVYIAAIAVSIIW